MPQSRHRKTRGRRSSSRSTHSKKKSNQKTLVIAVLVILALAVAGSIFLFMNRGGDGSGASAGETVTTASGLKYVELVEGTGRAPTNGRMVSVHYTGTLEDGTKFESSLDRGKPIQFPIGTGGVIKGWDEGIMTMKVGGKRKLIIPPNLGYGAAGRPPKIPPNTTLVFEVELVDAQ